MLTKREKAAMDRVAYMRRAADVIAGFVTGGYGAISAVHATARQEYPELMYDEIYQFWNFRTLNDDVLKKLENVLQKLKSE